MEEYFFVEREYQSTVTGPVILYRTRHQIDVLDAPSESEPTLGINQHNSLIHRILP